MTPEALLYFDDDDDDDDDSSHDGWRAERKNEKNGK